MDPREVVSGWKQLEHAFNVTRAAEQQPGANQMAGDAGPRLYVCPKIRWPKYPMSGMAPMQALENGEEAEEPGPRVGLAKHLREEANYWDQCRTFVHQVYLRTVMTPREGEVLDAETFESMERLPGTAIGLWLFPAEAFKEDRVPPTLCFNMPPVRPGLFLFEV